MDTLEYTETEIREDTPAIAVARKREVLWLQEVLLDRTRMCALIQREPGNALARFLFSSSLHEPRREAPDPLLSRQVSYDTSLLKELRKAGVDLGGALEICRILSKAIRNSVDRLMTLRTYAFVGLDTQHAVVIAPHREDYEVVWGAERERISARHLSSLRQLYRTHTPSDREEADFARRVFCLLRRYDAVGGPTYQCSVTREVFAVLRKDFGVTKECFASPLNRNADVFWSGFADTDRFFGSHGSFFESWTSPLVTEGGGFYANPPFVEEYIERLCACVRTMMAWSVAVTFAIVLPVWEDCAGYSWFASSPFTQVHLVLLPGRHVYMDGKQHTGSAKAGSRHAVNFSSACFILQNEQGKKQVSVDEGKRRRLLESFSIRERVNGRI